MPSSAAKEVYDRQEKICYLYNRYFVITDNKNTAVHRKSFNNQRTRTGVRNTIHQRS